ncbi:SGNH/GDSL hydrolase family protein [Actinokineospora inagensis]|uniref:SGNH/GDSL hydrolase family protein n=1 Tax=Actinokineospora inagensis TaxID=103730 RepID=UPI000423288E|nr:SGNH/GDSL hydrolase family protein [Actinokineospora inagensis]
MTRARGRLALVLSVVSTVALATPAAAKPLALEWVALGDSYTAGVIPAAGVELPVPGGRDGCGRTAGSYPELLRTSLAGRFELHNVSCGSATIANLFYEPQDPTGYNMPFFDVYDPDYPFPTVPAQIDAVTESAKLVTVGAGGNTFGFAELLYACLQLGASADKDTDHPCEDYFTSGGDGVPTVTERLTQVSDQYGDLLESLQQQAPNVTILAIGYPKIIPDDVSTCAYGFTQAGLRNFGTATYPDLNWLRTDVLEPLNHAIAQQATLHRATYIDTYTPSTGHDVCRPDGTNWTEGIMDRSGGWALVHPNTAGHHNVATLIEAALATH